MKKISIIIISIFFSCNLLKAQLQTKSVSVFKNNKAFFIKSGTVTTNANKYQLSGEMPSALFGTLWFQSPTNSIKIISSEEQNIEKKGLPISNYEILKANLNKNVFIYLSATEIIEGVIQNFSKDFDEVTKTYYPPTFVTLKSKDKWNVIKIEDIKRIGFIENPEDKVVSFEKKKMVTIDFIDNNTTQPLNMMYLENGLGWSPNYLLELTSENKGILTLQAQVKNEAEDITNSDVSFVVGNANFK